MALDQSALLEVLDALKGDCALVGVLDVLTQDLRAGERLASMSAAVVGARWL